MDKLYPILAQMKTSLDELEAIMIEEVNQLNRTQINPVSLQVLADNKTSCLPRSSITTTCAASRSRAVAQKPLPGTR